MKLEVGDRGHPADDEIDPPGQLEPARESEADAYARGLRRLDFFLAQKGKYEPSVLSSCIA